MVLTRPFDPARYIKTPEDAIEHLRAAFEDGDPDVIAAIVDAVARSDGLRTAIAAQVGSSKPEQPSARSAGPSSLSSALEVFSALGLRLRLETAPMETDRSAVGG